MPENFYDDYEGRPAAAAQEMSVWKDMDIIYDTKMYRKDKETPLKSTYESFIGRLDPEERKQYDAFYEPIIEEFYKKESAGKGTGRMEVPALYARLCEGCKDSG